LPKSDAGSAVRGDVDNGAAGYLRYAGTPLQYITTPLRLKPQVGWNLLANI
jgi:hypothetical protein